MLCFAVQGLTSSFYTLNVMLSTFATFATYVAVGGTLTAAKVFSIASIFASGRVVMSLFLPNVQ